MKCKTPHISNNYHYHKNYKFADTYRLHKILADNSRVEAQ